MHICYLKMFNFEWKVEFVIKPVCVRLIVSANFITTISDYMKSDKPPQWSNSLHLISHICLQLHRQLLTSSFSTKKMCKM